MDSSSDDSLRNLAINEPDTNAAASNKRKNPVEIGSEFCKRSCSKLYLDEKSADVHFVFPEENVPAHKHMLANGSPVFMSMFYGALKEEGNVNITDCRMESFKEFLQFFYLANVRLTIENAAEVMNLVNKYGALECFPVCERFLMENFSMDIVCWALELTNLFDRVDLRQFLLQKIMAASKEFFDSNSFKNCTPEILKLVLQCESFSCAEMQVFRACIAWSSNACKKKNLDESNMSNIRQELGDCLHLIQFLAMNRYELSSMVTKYEKLFTRDELIEFITILSGMESTNLNYFVYKTRVKPIEWKDNASMMFSLVNFTECDLMHVERTFFRTNRKLQLGAVATQLIHSKTQRNGKKLGGVMKILEVEKGKDREYKVLWMQPFVVALGGKHLPRNITKLEKPITIEPFKTYTIQIEFDSSWIEGGFRAQKCNIYKRILIQDYEVKFAHGIISHLYFN